MEKEKNPLIAAIVPVAASGIKSLFSLIRDKRHERKLKALPILEIKEKLNNSPVTEAAAEAIQAAAGELISTGGPVQLSSKRLMNIVGTGIIITFGLGDMKAHEINGSNTIVLGLGIAYCLGMSLFTYLSERGK